MIFGLDFDGTCVTHDFPEIGEDIGAQRVLRRMVEMKHRIVLNTMRSDMNGSNHLSDAVQWFKKNDIPLYGVNNNPEQIIWTSSPKVHADVYIDDRAIGCPLKQIRNKIFVDWDALESAFEKAGWI